MNEYTAHFGTYQVFSVHLFAKVTGPISILRPDSERQFCVDMTSRKNLMLDEKNYACFMHACNEGLLFLETKRGEMPFFELQLTEQPQNSEYTSEINVDDT